MAKFIRFLLVDDDVDDTSIFKEVLEEVSPSIDFVSAGDGNEALSILKRPNSILPDVIFLDLNMPRIDGKECLSALKCTPHHPSQKTLKKRCRKELFALLPSQLI